MNRIKNRFCFSIVFFIVVLHLFPMSSWGQPASYHRKVDQSTLLFIFQHQLFKSLNAKLEEYQSAYDQDYLDEDNLFDAFDVFSKNDTACESLYGMRNERQNENNQDRSLISDITLANDHQEKGTNLANAEKYEEAINECSEVIRVVPYGFAPYFNRAIYDSRLGKDDAAHQDFRRVVELKPDYLDM